MSTVRKNEKNLSTQEWTDLIDAINLAPMEANFVPNQDV